MLQFDECEIVAKIEIWNLYDLRLQSSTLMVFSGKQKVFYYYKSTYSVLFFFAFLAPLREVSLKDPVYPVKILFTDINYVKRTLYLQFCPD